WDLAPRSRSVRARGAVLRIWHRDRARAWSAIPGERDCPGSSAVSAWMGFCLRGGFFLCAVTPCPVPCGGTRGVASSFAAFEFAELLLHLRLSSSRSSVSVTSSMVFGLFRPG